MRFDEDGELASLFGRVGLDGVRSGALVVEAAYCDFDDLWAPLPSGVGPSGAFVAGLARTDRETLRLEYWRRLGSPSGPFTLSARAWYAVGTA